MHNNSCPGDQSVPILNMKDPAHLVHPSQAAQPSVYPTRGIAKPLKASLGARAAVSASTKIRILIADDHPIVRRGLNTLLATQRDFSVVGEAHDGIEALQYATTLRPDVMLLDLSMPGVNGIEVMQTMSRSNAPKPCQTILLTADVDRSDILRLLRMGLRGVVRKDAPPEVLFESIRTVHGGEVWVGRDTMTDVVEALAQPSIDSEPTQMSNHVRLTPREREIVELLVQGETNKRIAKRLSVTQDTVKHHITSIFDKTGVSNRLELVLFALHHRLVDTPHFSDGSRP